MVECAKLASAGKCAALGGMCGWWRVSLRGDTAYQDDSWIVLSRLRAQTASVVAFSLGGVVSLRGIYFTGTILPAW